MQQAEINWDQQELKQRINEVKGEVTKLAARREELEREHHRHSPLFQRFSKYIGFGTAKKLEWVRFKLNFQQEELARLTLQSNVYLQGKAAGPSTMQVAQSLRANETIHQKMERMVRENPPALEIHIRQIYQNIIETAPPAAH